MDTPIDAQHQELFARADALMAAVLKGNASEEIEEAFIFLERYCRSHFAAEEVLMKQSRYPEIEAHRALHSQFFKDFSLIKGRFTAKEFPGTVLVDLQKLVCGWLVGHIATVDKKLSSFLKPVKAPPEPLRKTS